LVRNLVERGNNLMLLAEQSSQLNTTSGKLDAARGPMRPRLAFFE
jgi:hypothetical protein